MINARQRFHFAGIFAYCTYIADTRVKTRVKQPCFVLLNGRKVTRGQNTSEGLSPFGHTSTALPQDSSQFLVPIQHR